MYRISSQLTHSDSQFHLRRREYILNRIQNQISSNERIKDLRDDPSGAAEATRLHSFLHRQRQYYDNTQFAYDTYRFTEGRVREAVDIMQRIRELAVQGANGIYSSEERVIMGTEVNELLKELTAIANSKNADGNALFGGTAIATDPFRVQYGNVDGALGQQITAVDYQGNIDSRSAEIAENTLISLDYPGNQIFWAQNHRIFSQVDARGYRVIEPSEITIDGIALELTVGDSIASIIDKINRYVPAVQATLDPTRNSLVISSTQPHQLVINESGTALQDLGILDPNNSPSFISQQADQFGSSIFENIIALRDAFYRNDSDAVGSQLLRGIDDGLNSTLTHLADIGAKETRVEFVSDRHLYDIPEITERANELTSVDITEAIVRLREEENSHRAALAVTARIIPQTLLDFLR